jgi:hypothetical protein
MSMALRGKAVTKEPDPEEPTQELLSQRRKPEIGQFRLQVDRQTKATFSTYEAAEEAGKEIKKGHPVVRVAVYDTVECPTQSGALVLPGRRASVQASWLAAPGFDEFGRVPLALGHGL